MDAVVRCIRSFNSHRGDSDEDWAIPPCFRDLVDEECRMCKTRNRLLVTYLDCGIFIVAMFTRSSTDETEGMISNRVRFTPVSLTIRSLGFRNDSQRIRSLSHAFQQMNLDERRANE
jgi:hypothetical protein